MEIKTIKNKDRIEKIKEKADSLKIINRDKFLASLVTQKKDGTNKQY